MSAPPTLPLPNAQRFKPVRTGLEPLAPAVVELRCHGRGTRKPPASTGLLQMGRWVSTLLPGAFVSLQRNLSTPLALCSAFTYAQGMETTTDTNYSPLSTNEIVEAADRAIAKIDTPIVMVSQAGDAFNEVQGHYNFKRSAKKVFAAAIETGWSLMTVERTEFSVTLNFERFDIEAQKEAEDRAQPLTLFTAVFDVDGGAYFSAQFRTLNGGYAGRLDTDTVSGVCSTLGTPQARIDQFNRRNAEAATTERKQNAGDALRSEYLASDERNDNYTVRRIEELAAYEPQPVTAEGVGRDITWFLRAAQSEAVNVVAAGMAQRALAIEGHAATWTDEVPSEPISLTDACQQAAQEVVQRSGNNAPQEAAVAVEAWNKVCRGW